MPTGIFRNPLSVIEGGYGGISMMLHSFSCLTVKENWPEVKTFRVRPLKKMGEIFINALPKEQVTVNRVRGDLWVHGIEEQNIEVPVEILANLHRAKEAPLEIPQEIQEVAGGIADLKLETEAKSEEDFKECS